MATGVRRKILFSRVTSAQSQQDFPSESVLQQAESFLEVLERLLLPKQRIASRNAE
jgi:hypothetical protein